MLTRNRGLLAAAMIAAGALALTGCTSSNPLGSALNSDGAGSASTGTITIGSAAFPEDEILAEVYAQALENNGITVKRSFNIGQREVYLSALKDGSIDLIPEYSGNLLQYYDKTATAASSTAVYTELKQKIPSGFEILKPSRAQDKDSYNVTQQFSQKYHVTSLADLKNVPIPLKLASNPENAERPGGIHGLKRLYGVTVALVPISDSGGPLTVKALLDGTVQMADVFTTSPAIKSDHLVTLTDPKNMVLAQNVLPLINTSKASPQVTQILNAVSAQLTTDDLMSFNAKNGGSAKESPAAIAKAWLAGKKL
ncbi:MAG: ABC transporter substrate-binding protein [Microbacteriaceae bacterium]|nr:MAG: ABC transporter substrate-binding protein [Microbacteriaceae bacterium]